MKNTIVERLENPQTHSLMSVHYNLRVFSPLKLKKESIVRLQSYTKAIPTYMLYTVP